MKDSKTIRQRWLATETYRDGKFESREYHQHPGVVDDFADVFGFKSPAAKVDYRILAVRNVEPPKFAVLIVDLSFLGLLGGASLCHYFADRRKAQRKAEWIEEFRAHESHRAWVIEVDRYGEPKASEIDRLRPIIQDAKEAWDKLSAKREKDRQRRRRYEQRKRDAQGRKEVTSR